MNLFKVVLKLMERETMLNVLVIVFSFVAFLIFAVASGNLSDLNNLDATSLATLLVLFLVIPFVAFHFIYSAATAWLYNTLANKAQFNTDSPSSMAVMRARLIRTFTERKIDITILEPPSFPIEKIVLSLAQSKGVPTIIYSNTPFIAIGTYGNEHTRVSIYAEDTLEGRSLGKNLETTLKHN